MEGRLDGYAFAASRPELGLPQMSRETQPVFFTAKGDKLPFYRLWIDSGHLWVPDDLEITGFNDREIV